MEVKPPNSLSFLVCVDEEIDDTFIELDISILLGDSICII